MTRFYRSYSVSSESMGIGVHSVEFDRHGRVVSIGVNPDIQDLFELSHAELKRMIRQITGSASVTAGAYADFTNCDNFRGDDLEDLDEDGSEDVNSCQISVDTQVVDGEYGKFFRTVVKHNDFDAVGLARTREMSEVIAYRNLADALKESMNDCPYF